MISTKATMNSGQLPEFDNPPVSEVALSVEFLPLPQWHSAHAGLFWNQIAKDYPHTESQLGLSSQVEKFGPDIFAGQEIRVEFPDPDSTRFWFIAESKTRLIQVQKNRFITNWRKVRGDEAYPRYSKQIRPQFEKEWGRYKQFLMSQALGEPNVQQCEVTYVNDIPQGEGWDSFAQLPRLFAPWRGEGTEGFLPAPETLTVGGSFLMPDERGRLHFATQHLRRSLDDKEVIQLRLVARGKPRSGQDADILDWMDFGREWIVRGFADLTTKDAHNLWKRTR